MTSTSLPCCGYVVDAADYLGEGKRDPRAGDITICLNCGQALVFTNSEGGTRPARAGDLMNGLSQDERDVLQKARRFIIMRGRIH